MGASGTGKVPGICQRGGETIRDQGAYLLPDDHALSLLDRNSPSEPESGDQMDQRWLFRVFQSKTKTLRSSVPGALQSRAGGRG